MRKPGIKVRVPDTVYDGIPAHSIHTNTRTHIQCVYIFLLGHATTQSNNLSILSTPAPYKRTS